MPLFFTCLSLEIFFLIRLYSVAPIFQGGWTTTGQSAFLLVREGVTSFMRANFTPYITKIQEIPWAPTSTGLTGSQKAAPETEKKSTHNQNSWIPPCNICDPYEVYQKHMMAISVWFCFFLELSHLNVGLSRLRFKHPTIRVRMNVLTHNKTHRIHGPLKMDFGVTTYAFFKRSHSLKYYSVMWPPITV